MTEAKKHTHPIVAKIIRLKISLLLVSVVAIFGLVYLYSSESKQPFIGYPKQLNKILLTQEIENAQLMFSIDSLVIANEKLVKENETIEGIVFEVQIGSFESFNIDKYSDDLEILNYTNDGGANHIILGKFRDIDDAKMFVDDLKRIGIPNATIVSKIDGKSVNIRE